MEIQIQKVQPGAQIPKYQTGGASAVDLHACIDTPITLEAGQIQIVPTGIALELPTGIEAQVRARSGLAAKNGIGLVNGIGTIDSDYRGEIRVILINWGKKDFVIEPQMRIAQMVFSAYEQVQFEVVDQLRESVRAKGKFGSTGL